MTTQTTDYTELTITEVNELVWYAGILHNSFTFANGATGTCKASIYRTGRFDTEQVLIKGIGWRNFALASMPANWTPKVGDIVKVHPSQL